MSTIFTKIIKGEIPSYKIYEDELTFAFLDINPINAGHSLVIPKKEVDYFVDLENPWYNAVFQTAKQISPAIEKATKCKRVGSFVLGFDVPHFHYHLVPLWTPADLSLDKARPATQEELLTTQKQILAHL